jgi:hypothetical protein
MAESVILKGVQSPERLLDETSLFLHLVASELPPVKQQMLSSDCARATKRCEAERYWWSMMTCATFLP